jgi:hypothetical protein
MFPPSLFLPVVDSAFSLKIKAVFLRPARSETGAIGI